MTILRRGSPILTGDGHKVARMGQDMEIKGSVLYWPIRTTYKEYASKDQEYPYDQMVHQGELWVDYERGETQVLLCKIPDGIDHDLIFYRPMFVRADKPLGETPGGILTALKIVSQLPPVRSTLHHDDMFWDYMIDKYTYLDSREGK